VIDFVTGCVVRLRQECDNPPRLILSGGNAAPVAAALEASAEIRTDLVFEGLEFELP
jgi:pantothenate kinase type III